MFRLCASSNVDSGEAKKRTKLDVFAEQICDSCIVAGIAALSLLATGSTDFKAVAVAFGLSFLLKLKEYRGLNQ